MSIITGRGDHGQTDLLFGRRVAKTSARVAALGAVDELTSALGMARTSGLADGAAEVVDAIQERLVALMGQLATLPEDVERYAAAGYGQIQAEDVDWLARHAHGLEESGLRFRGWARPGAGAPPASAFLDFARAVARRAEREVRLVHETEGAMPEPPLLFLNRLSDLLWLMAREAALG